MMPIERILKTQKMRLLVIGGSGRLGALLRAAWEGPGAVGEEAPRLVWQARRDDAFGNFGGPTTVFDPLGRPDALAAAIGAAEATLHLAGATSGNFDEHEALALATARAAGGRPVIYASSAAVYGDGGARPEPRRDAPLSEDDVIAPLSPYGAAKARMEAALSAGGFAAGATVIRIGNVAGADALLGRPAPAGGRKLDLFADGRAARRSYIGPGALARAIARLARLAVAGADLPRTINLALPGAVGMDALLDAEGAPWRGRPAPSGAIARVELDVARAVRLGLVPDEEARAQEIVADLGAVVRPAASGAAHGDPRGEGDPR